MRSIFKYALAVMDRQMVSMPAGAKVLCAQNQGGQVTIWAEVDTEAKREPRAFWIVGTGNPMPDVPLAYVGTVQVPPFRVARYYEPTLNEQIGSIL